jgi:hypothetical protein
LLGEKPSANEKMLCLSAKIVRKWGFYIAMNRKFTGAASRRDEVF